MMILRLYISATPERDNNRVIYNVCQSVAESLAIPIERVHIQLRDMSPYECGSGGKSAAELMGLKD